MAMLPARLYIDRVVPAQFAQLARARAIAENPANAGPLEAIGDLTKRWEAGRTLKITFLDGQAVLCEKVAQTAGEWLHYANLTFAFGEHPDAEIRISFTGYGSWSAVGTDALLVEYYRPHEPTMNFGWLADPALPEEDFAATVLHEFGHAIGLLHEHQSPASGIRWNRAAVIRDLSGPPNNWTPVDIDHNVLKCYSGTVTQFTQFDPLSIMLYPIPRHWTLDGTEIAANKQLSEQDKAFIQRWYPR